MTIRAAVIALLVVLLSGVSCRTGTPVVDTGARPPTQHGTIAGHVRTDGAAAVVSRVVRAVSLDDGQRYETSTNSAGTYTLKVPPGRYRIELELHQGERLVSQPGETNVNLSDLDPRRDFEISAAR